MPVPPERKRIDSGTSAEIELALSIADLSGYTALAEAHGAVQASETVLTFQGLVRDTLEPGVEIVDSTGDEVFCAGGDTLAVVRAAIRLRDALDRIPDFLGARIGLHRGLVVARNGQLFGPAVNLTARVAASAAGGQVLCTEAIAEAVTALADFEPHAIGERRFKNVPRAVQVYELARPAGGRDAVAIDPVCRMRVAADRAAETIDYEGTRYRFCSSGRARVRRRA